ncbi:hypothetical protein F5890DRAFT_1554162 [Lentinula detonsa]|uniref:Uncharacterized protein n=1 Tax=Lentinula detonsa TaxID=2804962 RepID=A0AA38USM2_9AGAR|nr:hypothetical protein F5890DRAFT_1554162 [Lentinula detonsa]
MSRRNRLSAWDICHTEAFHWEVEGGNGSGEAVHNQLGMNPRTLYFSVLLKKRNHTRIPTRSFPPSRLSKAHSAHFMYTHHLLCPELKSTTTIHVEYSSHDDPSLANACSRTFQHFPKVRYIHPVPPANDDKCDLDEEKDVFSGRILVVGESRIFER